MKVETELENLNSVSKKLIIKLIKSYDNFEEVDFFVFSHKSLKSIEYFYCATFANCTFVTEKWYNESVNLKEWQDYKNYVKKFNDDVSSGVNLTWPFEILHETCFVFYEPYYYSEKPEKIELLLSKILIKVLKFKNVVFNEKKF